MNINILFVLLAIAAVWRGCCGAKRGAAGEIYRLISLVISLFVLSLGILLYTSIREKNALNIILGIAALILAGILSKLVRLLLKSLKALAHLPVLSFLDKLLGILIGVAEIVVVLWIVYVIIGKFDTGLLGAKIMEWTQENEVLQKLYDLNGLAYWLAGL